MKYFILAIIVLSFAKAQAADYTINFSSSDGINFYDNNDVKISGMNYIGSDLFYKTSDGLVLINPASGAPLVNQYSNVGVDSRCRYISSDCSGICYVPSRPPKGRIIVNSAGSAYKVTGNESTSVQSFLSMGFSGSCDSGYRGNNITVYGITTPASISIPSFSGPIYYK